LYEHVDRAGTKTEKKSESESERKRERERERERERHTQMKNARNLQQLLTLATEESRHNVPLMYVLTRRGVDLFQVRLN